MPYLISDRTMTYMYIHIAIHVYVGLLGTNIEEVRGQLSCHVTSRLALIGGTSTCHMAVCSHT